MSRSPAVILYDAAGNAMAVADGVAIPANTKGLLAAGKSPTGDAAFLGIDAYGRLKVVNPSIGTPTVRQLLRVISAGEVIYDDYTVAASKQLEVVLAYCGGLNPGVMSIARHTPSTVAFIDNGDFESSGQVAAWAAVTGSFTAPSPDSNSTQFQTGAASMRWIYASSATALQRRQTFSPVLDLTNYRYLRVKFFNDAATGTTRTISIVISSGTPTRTYSLAGTLGTAPFTANTWITLEADLENPTSSTGTGFDLTSIDTISLKMQDGANKTGTVYWDTLRQEDQLDTKHRIYNLGDDTRPITINPAAVFVAGDAIYMSVKNAGTTRSEMAASYSGYLLDV